MHTTLLGFNAKGATCLREEQIAGSATNAQKKDGSEYIKKARNHGLAASITFLFAINAIRRQIITAAMATAKLALTKTQWSITKAAGKNAK